MPEEEAKSKTKTNPKSHGKVVDKAEASAKHRRE